MVRKLQNSAAEASIDVDAVIEFFGGRQTLVEDLKRYEIVEIDVTAIDKWRRRGIPAARRADLQELARLKKQKFNFNNYSTKPNAKIKKVA